MSKKQTSVIDQAAFSMIQDAARFETCEVAEGVVQLLSDKVDAIPVCVANLAANAAKQQALSTAKTSVDKGCRWLTAARRNFIASCLGKYIPTPVLERIRAGFFDWLSELRQVGVMFVYVDVKKSDITGESLSSLRRLQRGLSHAIDMAETGWGGSLRQVRGLGRLFCLFVCLFVCLVCLFVCLFACLFCLFCLFV